MEMAKQGFGLVVVVGAPDYVTGVNHIQSVLHGAFFGFVDFFVIFASSFGKPLSGGIPLILQANICLSYYSNKPIIPGHLCIFNRTSTQKGVICGGSFMHNI